ncbi:Olfactory receptor 7G1 [Nibea albiflora]|uniref:Olfactory receptor 7G1 n=1 Tax=Nibea albiflora TaxID=240163 RepID=A0ACB7F2H7_NIBAL|nr:Olfactory receptor 7G1 [Nibea albiflora]
MVSALLPKANISTSLQYHEVMLFGMVSIGSSCSFLYINGVLLFTLRNKPVFCETSRYILLFNLLLADTAHLVSNIMLYLLSSLRIKITYFACSTIVLLSVFTAPVSPLTLAVMSLERYVAVCHPLRHATIFTMRSTGMAIALVWGFSFIHILIRVFMLIYVFTRISLNLHLTNFCSKEAIFFAAIFNDFEEAYASTLFLSVGLAIMTSYIGVALVARNKPVFCETSRYILLYNLLFADTAHLVSNLLLYLMASLRLKITYYACSTLVLLSIFTATISPLTLAVMSLERYVAVCHPLRHATIFTMRSTGMACALVWGFSFIHILIRVFMLIYVFTKISVNLDLNDFCSKEAIFFAPLFNDFEEAYASTLFLSVGLAIITSYIGVALVASSVSTDNASARKALRTLLLHLIQLSLILTSTLYTTIIVTIVRTVGRLALLRLYNVCFVFLNILPRNKPVFCETSRYILLYNLLFADTAHLVSNLLLYLMASLRLKITYYACSTLVLLSIFTATISPLTLAVMSLERYVAVCHPLRHATIFTMRSTGMACALVWGFSFIHILIRVFMLIYVFTKISVNLDLNDFCSKEAIFFAPLFNDFEEAYASTLFLSVGLAIMASYIGVALVARSVSTDKASAIKALQTLLLHLIQLSLILTSTLFSTIVLAIATTVGRAGLMRIYNLCFVFLSILPRCLSALIYGLRDQTIRPVLLQNLCCWWRCSIFLNKCQS